MHKDRFMFRAWISDLGRFADEVTVFGDSSWSFSLMRDFGWDECTPSDSDMLMQSIGRQDKNETLIFEYDIVKAVSTDNPEESVIHVIKYKDGGYWIPVLDGYGWELMTLSLAADNSPWYEYEVIGNIYENAELIEEHYK